MRSNSGYGENAEALTEQYESVTFSDVHRDVLHLFPSQPSRILDIGAGTGRDAAALASSGHDVTAVEPTMELRGAGMRIHAAQPIVWIDDSLPELAVVRGRGGRYDVVMLTAVWMHLDEAQRGVAMPHLAALLTRKGRVVMSLRHGPVPAGRTMHDVSAAETIELAASAGLRCIHHGQREDMLGRGDVSWSFLGLEAD
ncbi:2-polyprenyl-3-methyl-5-hydroxy-6-metoxy-1,4-benzoquinol methylase [Azospirillum agricola]|uniref:class I SAM-dependent methyltransferase n=1 Tax=Azospirillum agricola TaxID=1720247 RepID=UPI001AE503A4|nr:class I SAM-dependent methyltransferase [Azospirillum agricola]MBP2227377.1 2-polyprenyl-3-methyl-5-hydroxy-6-metoxy-1,4-benzoquinol methylase [Azospirillum agricola]